MTADAGAMTAPDPTATMGHGELFNFLMGTKYIPAIQDTLRRENERRADAFADNVTYTVCGEEIRLMTPRDLLMLDGFENAFVCAREPSIADAQWFLWTLNIANNGRSHSWANRYRKGKHDARIALREDFECDCGEIYSYLDRLWLDEPADEATKDPVGVKRERRKPATVYCIAPLLVNVASSVGATDPMSGLLLADTPIPRLLQYQRAANERRSGEDAATSFDSMKSRCMEEVNNIIAARNAERK